MVTPKKLGIIGFSEGNGHPYSFSAIINGFNDAPENWVQWEGILNYLVENKKEVGIETLRVTHIWTQSLELSEKISRACHIENVCHDWSEMIEQVDGLLLARDDWKSHYEIAIAFLKKDIPVFVDKPLTLDTDELNAFIPYLDSGLLMSCSGLRYSKETLTLKEANPDFNGVKFINATVVNDWERYGIHILDAIFGLYSPQVDSIEHIKGGSFLLSANSSDFRLLINPIGPTAKTFNIQFWTEKDRYEVEIQSNFHAFKNTLEEFANSLVSRKPAYDPSLTPRLMKILKAGNESKAIGKKVSIND